MSWDAADGVLRCFIACANTNSNLTHYKTLPALSPASYFTLPETEGTFWQSCWYFLPFYWILLAFYLTFSLALYLASIPGILPGIYFNLLPHILSGRYSKCLSGTCLDSCRPLCAQLVRVCACPAWSGSCDSLGRARVYRRRVFAGPRLAWSSPRVSGARLHLTWHCEIWSRWWPQWPRAGIRRGKEAEEGRRSRTFHEYPESRDPHLAGGGGKLTTTTTTTTTTTATKKTTTNNNKIHPVGLFDQLVPVAFTTLLYWQPHFGTGWSCQTAPSPAPAIGPIAKAPPKMAASMLALPGSCPAGSPSEVDLSCFQV